MKRTGEIRKSAKRYWSDIMTRGERKGEVVVGWGGVWGNNADCGRDAGQIYNEASVGFWLV